MSLHEGASQLFVRANACPAERVQVTPRPDLRPRVVIPPDPMPPVPAELANDPERVRLWQSQQPRQPDLDAIGETFEVTGCNKTTLFVCAHPRNDGGSGPWSASVDSSNGITLYTESHADVPNTSSVDLDVVMSSVVCLPGTAVVR